MAGESHRVRRGADVRKTAAAEHLDRHPAFPPGQIDLRRLRGFAQIGDAQDDLGLVVPQIGQHLRVGEPQKGDLAGAEGRKTYKIGDVGLHHYAFQLRSRRDVDALQAFLEKEKVRIVDPADEYYEDYYAVFFLDPDGLKLEGMKYGELTAKKKKAKASKSKG